MPNWTRLARQVNRVIQKRGGPESVKEDAQELEAIAKEKRPMSEKLKEAAQAVREPGAPHAQQPRPPAVPAEQPNAPQDPPAQP